MRKWFRVIARRKSSDFPGYEDKQLYIYREDIGSVLDTYKRVPKVRDIRRGGRVRFPDVREVSENGGKQLEGWIRSDKNITLEKAKMDWYYCSEIFD